MDFQNKSYELLLELMYDFKILQKVVAELRKIVHQQEEEINILQKKLGIKGVPTI